LHRPVQAAPAGDPSTSHTKESEGSPAGPDGRRWTHTGRGTACDSHMPPPGGGMNLALNHHTYDNQNSAGTYHGSNSFHGPRVDLPQFDGANP
jgi:hypothetical protein